MRRCQLKRERDQSDLHEAEMKARLQERVDRRNERLDGVVQQVREADGEKNRQHGGFLCGAPLYAKAISVRLDSI